MNKPLHFIIASVLFAAIFFGVNTPAAHAQSINTLSGYAWSSNIGWISFSGSGYGVTLDMTTGNLVGYAWSSNIGWIKFGGLSNFPNVPGSGTTAADARVNFTTGAVTGWALACGGTLNNAPNQNLPGDCSSMNGRTDGADGWLALSGTGYGITYTTASGIFAGYMWGNMTGWTAWNPTGVATPPCTPSLVCIAYNPPGVTLNANPYTVTAGSNTTLSWSATNNPSSCALTSTAGLNASGLASSSASYPVTVNSPTTFSMSCTNTAGSGSASVAVSTTSAAATPGFVSMWLNNSPAMTLSAVKIHPTGKVTLNWDGSKFATKYAAYSPQCSGISTGQTVTGWTNASEPAQALNNSSNVVTLQNLSIGTYNLQMKCFATIVGKPVSSSSNPVSITVTQSVIREQ